MSRLYDTVEPSVIDENLLVRCVEEQGPKDVAGRIAKAEGIDFGDVLNLRLDFKNILKIDNLWCFTSLVKLQLDNNIIERIEGLENLIHLTWLDLSFNNIEVIEGLNTLTKLEDLTLYNNRIQKIENMENLLNLQVLSIGNNHLKELENLIFLRRFKQLKTLNLEGNPFCTLHEYKVFVVSHLSRLDYLDYRLVDAATRTTGLDRYYIAIEELIHDETAAERKLQEQKALHTETELHKLAYVENLNGPFMFESMYADDTEGRKLNFMPTLDELLQSYNEKFTAVCQEIFKFGLEQYTKRVDEVDQFDACILEAETDNKQMAINEINKFMAFKKQLFEELPQLTDTKILETKMADYHKEVSDLRDKLMSFEMQIVDQLDEAVKDFGLNLAELVGAFIENVQALIAQMREMENLHHEKLLEISILTLEKVVKNEIDEEIPEDLRMLFVDKDTIINAVSSSHDVHLLKIDNLEDDIVTRINQWMGKKMEDLQKGEISRNRVRVTEISNLVDNLRDDIDMLDLPIGGNY